MAVEILDALSELLEDEFKKFKWHLSSSGTKDSIARGKLESANRQEVVDLIVQQYKSSDAGTIAVRVLRKIKQNELADQLKRKLKKEDASAEEEASSGAAAVNPSKTGVTMTINSASGGTVKAPVLQGGVYHGSLNFS
ncbi:hypothetical protein QQF64_000234 [Cirrhinus molitorella]|uniref:Pyrin domain-containing protein n=1 Tax=Cirrhinus molitorella TaxID=172907 RepID=A0ABR3NXD2_9TELE